MVTDKKHEPAAFALMRGVKPSLRLRELIRISQIRSWARIRKLIWAIPLCVSVCIAQTYNTPSNVSPIAYPATIPCPSSSDRGCPIGALTGSGWTYTEPGFPDTPLLRVTDVDTPTTRPNPQWTVNCGGSAETSPMSLNDDRFYVCSNGGQIGIFSLSWPNITHLYGTTCILAGNPANCAPNLWFSRKVNDIAYGDSLGSGRSGSVHLVIYKYNFASTSGYTKTMVKDLSGCLELLGTLISNAYVDDATVSNDDQTFAVLGSTTADQDSPGAVYVVVWNRTKGCRVWNTSSGTISGDYGPIGHISGTSDTFTLHNVRLGAGGDWVKVTWANCLSGGCSSSYVENYLWQVGTRNVTVNSQAPDGCGHTAIGRERMANQCFLGYQQAFWQRANASPSSGTLLPAAHPGSNDLDGFDQHMTWPQGEPAAAYSTTVPTYTNGFNGPPDTNAWDGEGLALSTNGSGIVYRLFHTFNSYLCRSCFYTYNVLGAPSSDGAYYLFTTDWDGMLGNANGITTACNPTSNCRGDVFLAKLPIATR